MAENEGSLVEGRLAENILYFARALRAAGIPVGPGAVLDALEAVSVARVGDREDLHREQSGVSCGTDADRRHRHARRHLHDG